MSNVNYFECTPIQEFFNNSVIFITGGTGLLGSTLVEKLIRSCPGIKKIYLLIRNKKEKSSDQRMKEYFFEPFWDKLKKCSSNYEQYVSLINGDMINENLGISAEDYNIITQEVNIIFHLAAAVRFNEPLKIAVHLNIQGTKNILQLAEKCTNLKSFVHVSTAYSQCITLELEEKFYPLGQDPEDFLTFCNKYSEEELNVLTPSIIGQYPNTYTYTKSVAEHIVLKYQKILPIAIMRPSIVMSPYREPIPGWIYNLYGPVGLMIGVCMGLIRVLLLDKSRNTDVVPSDLCTNCLIAISYETSKLNHKERGIEIYNYGSGKDNPISWNEFLKWGETFGKIYACINKNIGFYFVIAVANVFWFNILQIIFHKIPAYCIDTALQMAGKKPKVLKLYERVDKAIELTKFFTLRQWTFHMDKTNELYKNMDYRDQELFCFDITIVQWDIFFFNIARNFRKYTMKKPINGVAEFEKIKITKYTIIICILLCLFSWWIFY